MTKLLTSTAVGLIAAFAVQAQAQDSNQTAQMDDPCTAQWTAVDANNDGMISESEAQNAIEAQFSQIDRDGDGMISIKNWKDCTVPSAIPGGFQSAAGTGTERTPAGTAGNGQQGTSGQALSSSESGQQDTSGQALSSSESGQQGTSGQALSSSESGQQGTSGQALSSSESGQQGTSGQALSSSESGQQGTSGQALSSSESGQQDTSEQAQATGDAGQQGTESTRALQAPQTGETPADWTDEAFTEMDTDYSGYVTSEEAGEWTRNRITAEMDDEETLGRYGAMFSMMDMDSDGRISEQEWQAREQMDVEDRFGRIDQDGDDQVSLSEWRDYREQRFEQARQDMQQGQTQQQDQEQAQADADQEPTIWLYYFRSL